MCSINVFCQQAYHGMLGQIASIYIDGFSTQDVASRVCPGILIFLQHSCSMMCLSQARLRQGAWQAEFS